MPKLLPDRQFPFILLITLLCTGTYGSFTPSWSQTHSHVTGSIHNASGLATTGTLAFFKTDQGSDPGDRDILRIPERTAWVNEKGRFEVKIEYGYYQLGYYPGAQKSHPGLPNKNFKPFLAGINSAERYVLQVAKPAIEAGAITFYPAVKIKTTPSFSLSGTVKTKTGKTLARITVVAKTDYNTFRPQFISKQTDKSGRYTLTLPPGSYYLFARHRLEKFGRPVTGEFFGIWGVNDPAGEFGWLPIKKDQDITIRGEVGQTINDADITVFRIPDPSSQEEVLRAGGKR